MQRVRLAALLLVLGLLCAPAAHAAPDPGWQPWTGPAAGDLNATVRAFATAGTVVFAATDGRGVLRSLDGGATWAPFSTTALPVPGSLIRDIDATTAAVTIATDGGLYRAAAAGGPWRELGQGSRPLPLNVPVATVLSMTKPTPALVVGGPSGISRSTDGGLTWLKGDLGLPAAASVYDLAPVPLIPHMALAATSFGVYATFDGGLSWTPYSNGLPTDRAILHVTPDQQQPGVWYALTDGLGVYRSPDAGQTWAPSNAGLGDDLEVRAIAFLPVATNVKRVVVGTEGGVYGSDDLGVTWQRIPNTGLTGSTVVTALASIPGTLDLVAGLQAGGVALRRPTAAAMLTGPTLSDTTPARGGTLTALPGTFEGTEPISLAYQWQRCAGPTPDTCADLAAATLPTYTPIFVDQGSRLRVVVTATNLVAAAPLVLPSVVTSPVAAASGPLPGETTSSQPVITPSGAVTVGQTLSSSTGSWNPTATLPFAYQWFRCLTSANDCTPIPGATAATHLLDGADAGFRIGVQVAASNANGTLLSSRVLTAATVLQRQVSAVTAPAVRGGPWIGTQLTGLPGSFSGPAAFTRQWELCATRAGGGCGAIGNATGPNYIPLANQRGKYLRVRITADVNGSAATPAPLSIVSPAVGPIAVGPPEVGIDVLPRIRGGTAVGLTLTGVRGTWIGKPQLSQRWLRCGASGTLCSAVPGAISLSLKLQPGDLGRRFVFEETAVNAWGRRIATRTVPTLVVTATIRPVYGTGAKVAGTFRVGRTVFARKGTWYALPKARFSYQWTRDGRKIAGARSSTYKLRATDRGHRVTCIVTARNALGSTSRTLRRHTVKR